jgi:2,2-dialkylglycine decarboxylase (pyruvate)
MKIGFEMYDMQSAGAPAAVIAEPIISAGGIIVPPAGYFDALQAEAKKRGMLLIFDEAQTAFGRIGHWFASTYLNVTPDIMTVSKTLGGGVPLAGVITNDDVESTCHRAASRSTRRTCPIRCLRQSAWRCFKRSNRKNCSSAVCEMGAYLAARLQELQSRHEEIGDVRGMGLLRGIELVKDRETREPYHELGALTTQRCLQLGLSMNIRRGRSAARSGASRRR